MWHLSDDTMLKTCNNGSLLVDGRKMKKQLLNITV